MEGTERMSCLCICVSASNCDVVSVAAARKLVFLSSLLQRAYMRAVGQASALPFECFTPNHVHTAHNKRSSSSILSSPPPLSLPPNSPVGSSLNHLSGTITGPDGTPYAKGVFKIDIHIPTSYPFEPPKMKFLTKIWCVGREREGGREGKSGGRKKGGMKESSQMFTTRVVQPISALVWPPSLGHI